MNNNCSIENIDKKTFDESNINLRIGDKWYDKYFFCLKINNFKFYFSSFDEQLDDTSPYIEIYKNIVFVLFSNSLYVISKTNGDYKLILEFEYSTINLLIVNDLIYIITEVNIIKINVDELSERVFILDYSTYFSENGFIIKGEKVENKVKLIFENGEFNFIN